jgi:small-conductance mechanosensitive channel
MQVSGRRKPNRAASVLPLIRALLFAMLGMLVLFVALTEFGVAIAPMLAGAGVFGVIAGLGAQSLLKDILAGIFYIIDDAFRIGEYVETGTLRGTVERISLRSMQIRHHRGAIHTVPYGMITSISNYSRDWVIEKMIFLLPLDTDVLRVKQIVKTVSAEYMEQDEAKYLLEPLKFQGIDAVDLNGLTVRLKFMAQPGEQFTIRRELLRRLQKAFAENGIEFAKRNVTVSGSGAAGGAAVSDFDDL